MAMLVYDELGNFKLNILYNIYFLITYRLHKNHIDHIKQLINLDKFV